VISPQLRDAAIAEKLHPATASGVQSARRRRSSRARPRMRSATTWPSCWATTRMYNLDRLDLKVVSTLDAQAQTAVTKVCASCATRKWRKRPA
jgi:membrane peptidoglycan carboxypeptidase